MKLLKEDYINILNYYNINYDLNISKTELKKITEKIIAEKLCSCVNKVYNLTNIKNKSLGICIWSVLNKKQLKINGFTCKNKKELKNKKNNKRDRERLYKTTKNKLSFYKK